MRTFLLAVFVGLVLLVVAAPSTVRTAIQAKQSREYVVLYTAGFSPAAARAAVQEAGGKVVRENAKVGVATVRSSNTRFRSDVMRHAAIDGVARNRRIGHVPAQPRTEAERADKYAFEKGSVGAGAQAGHAALGSATAAAEPLAGLQWGMEMIRATADTSHEVQPGDRGVLVGILDSGIDASHPDIAPNFNRELSRNFTVDIPSIVGPCEPGSTQLCEQPFDGPCAEEPDQSCSDPADVDESGHGTHVAGIVAAAANGLGVAGVAPNVTLVNIRVGQDAGFIFLQPAVDALTYAGDNGIDVANMSFFIDPWLFNCKQNPADSSAEQLEQRTIIRATQRALQYAHRRGVALFASAGNENIDLGHPTVDDVSPDFPFNVAKVREVDNSCLVLPTEGKRVRSVVALGPSERKSFYSSYGVEQAFVSAPGGDSLDATLPVPQHRVLSTYPESVLLADGEIDPVTGEPLIDRVIRDCQGGTCAYYRYLQGTSMASPHAAGVAALIVSEFGSNDPKLGGLNLAPGKTARILRRSARDHACPEPRLFTYEDGSTAFCEGEPGFNGFYGRGIVDALGAVTFRR